MKNNRITINISGNIYETHEATLRRYPNTLLGNHALMKRFYCQRSKQYFFNRDRNMFEAILFFYQSFGKLYRPENVSLKLFVEECNFFLIPKRSIEILKELEDAKISDCLDKEEELHGKNNLDLTWWMKVWNVLENPSSSLLARFYFTIQMIIVSICISMYCLETLPSYRSQRIADYYTLPLSSPWILIEIASSFWFLFDVFIRFTFAPDKEDFLKSPMTIVDILTIAPLTFLITKATPVTVANLLRLIRFIRVLKLLRFGKLSKRIRIVFYIIEDSLPDLQYFMATLTVIVTTGGGIIYFIEQADPNTGFISMPEGYWWSLQAFLTLGYGDIIPFTYIGKIFSCIYMVFGLTTIMMPVLSLMMKLVKLNEGQTQDEPNTQNK